MIAQDQATINTNISRASQQESLSLKTLSLVTMLFLPGTFIATLFSMPIIGWDSKGDGNFWVYWAIAVPLTLMTFAMWWIWTILLERKRKMTHKRQMFKEV